MLDTEFAQASKPHELSVTLRKTKTKPCLDIADLLFRRYCVITTPSGLAGGQDSLDGCHHMKSSSV